MNVLPQCPATQLEEQDYPERARSGIACDKRPATLASPLQGHCLQSQELCTRKLGTCEEELCDLLLPLAGSLREGCHVAWAPFKPPRDHAQCRAQGQKELVVLLEYGIDQHHLDFRNLELWTISAPTSYRLISSLRGAYCIRVISEIGTSAWASFWGGF